MKIDTKYFGAVEVTESDQIIFPKGLFGFESNQSYYPFFFEESEDMLLCLQSAEDPYLAFVLINPYQIIGDYSPQLTKEDFLDIDATMDSPIAYFAIAVVHENFQDSTVNLKCPIIVNLDKKLAKQVMLDDSPYTLRHPIIAQDKGE